MKVVTERDKKTLEDEDHGVPSSSPGPSDGDENIHT